jgi:hypothetical protein
LNCLHYPKGIGYIKLIDTISYEKEQLYVQIHNPDYVAGENDEPEMIYVPIFDALSSETKDKVYVS